MSNIKNILINVENLSDKEQLDLWKNLWTFADEKLPAKTNLMCFVMCKKNGKT